MKRIVCIAASAALLNSFSARAEDKVAAPPSIRDLIFMIGEWEIENRIYDHYESDKLLFVETGRKECSHDLSLNDEPQYIACATKWRVDHEGRKRDRETRDFYRYNRFLESIEEIGVYSNWPSHGANRVTFDPVARTLILEGELLLSGGVIERLQTTITYNEDFTAYESRNVANFSDLPVTQFNRVFTGKGRKVR